MMQMFFILRNKSRAMSRHPDITAIKSGVGFWPPRMNASSGSFFNKIFATVTLPAMTAWQKGVFPFLSCCSKSLSGFWIKFTNFFTNPVCLAPAATWRAVWYSSVTLDFTNLRSLFIILSAVSSHHLAQPYRDLGVPCGTVLDYTQGAFSSLAKT